MDSWMSFGSFSSQKSILAKELFYLSDARRLNFLCKLNTGLAGQKKANKNWWSLESAEGGWQESPCRPGLCCMREKAEPQQALCASWRNAFDKNTNHRYEGKFMRLQRPEKLTIHLVLKKEVWKVATLFFSPLFIQDICNAHFVSRLTLGTGKHI